MKTTVDHEGVTYTVSTIGADGMLVRFPETCVFRKRPGTRSIVVATYSTMADARTGHETWCDGPRIAAAFAADDAWLAEMMED